MSDLIEKASATEIRVTKDIPAKREVTVFKADALKVQLDNWMKAKTAAEAKIAEISKLLSEADKLGVKPKSAIAEAAPAQAAESLKP